MSKVIQVRNVPDEVHMELRQRASLAGVSLSEYVLAELHRISARSANAEILMRSALRSGGGFSQGEILDAIDAGRDEQ